MLVTPPHSSSNPRESAAVYWYSEIHKLLHCITRYNRVHCHYTIVGHTGAVFCMMELTDGRIVSGSMDVSLRVWQ